MFINHLFIYTLLLPSIVYSQCFPKSSQTWACNARPKSNITKTTDLNYQTILNTQNFEKLFLRNYQLSRFEIDNYPLTLRLLNASGNQFETVILTSKHRFTSNLRQLILQSNNIKQFNIDTIILPQSLEKLSLANNYLELLDPRLFSHLKNLIELDLSNNRLKRIVPQLLLNFNIRLNNNPLDCQCTPEAYRIVCEKSTNLKQTTSENKKCLAPYYDPLPYDASPPPYLRFSKFILFCPINSQPPPIIMWSTPFGNLSSLNSSSIDLLSFNNDKPFYVTITALAGPFTARTRHILHAFNTNYLSVTQARAALQHRLSCSGVNMLGIYTHEFDFDIDTYVEKRAIWQLIYTLGFGFFMSLVAGALCVTLKRTHYRQIDHLTTPPIYPTMTSNSASRTPPNLELNQWLALAAANISGTLEQVRDKLRSGVQQVSEHMGQTMGRASELFTSGVQHAGGTIRQAAETSAAYFQSIRETSQQRLNTMRVQTLSSIRNPGQLMRTGMSMFTTQVNSLRDYCGDTTGDSLPSNYLIQQQQLHHLQHSSASISYLRHNQITTINEDNESLGESTSLINPLDYTPYAGHIISHAVGDASGIGQLNEADNSVLTALNNFNQYQINTSDDEGLKTSGQMSAGIGTFHDHSDELVNEPGRLIIYGEERPADEGISVTYPNVSRFHILKTRLRIKSKGFGPLADLNSNRSYYNKHRDRVHRRMQTSSSQSISIHFDTSNNEPYHILPNSNLSLTFRFLRPGDQSEVKSLCLDWFPIEYPDKWYDDIVHDKRYYALAVCDVHTQRIVALIVADIFPLGNCNREDQQMLHKTFSLTTSVCYILILGVVKEYRRQGLASILLENLLNTLNKYGICKAVYLHVLYSNKQAIEFYQSKQFQYSVYLPNYYLIKGENLDAYCFARYINGGYPPMTLSDFFSNIWTFVVQTNPCRLFTILKQFVINKFLFTDNYQRTSSYKQISRIV